MTTGLPAFDRTVQETNLWLKDIEARLGASRHQAYTGLRAVLHVLRDRLPPETALHFADQLPTLLRGVSIEGWSLMGKPTGERSADAFVDRISAQLPPGFPINGGAAARAVFQTIRDRMDLGEVDKLMAHLPEPVRELWLEGYV